jgi:general secretion pathway protein J
VSKAAASGYRSARRRAGGYRVRVSAWRGFTLIEILLATALLAAGLALAFATLRAATAVANRGESLAQRNERMRAVEGFLRARLRVARPVAFALDPESGLAHRFAGDGEGVEFVADLPDYLGRGGPYLHRIRSERDGDGVRLVVEFRMVQGGAVIDDDASDGSRPIAPEILADGLRAVRFRYRGMGADQRLGEWQSQWDAAEALPLQVEVQLQDRDGRAWPTLLVALPLAGRYALHGMGAQ